MISELVTYQESAAALQREAAVAEIEQVSKLFKDFEKATESVSKNTVEAVNLARAIGITLQTMTGKEQVTFEFFEKHCSGKIPFSYQQAKTFISVARKMDKPAESVQEAAHMIQLCLIADGQLTIPERAEQQIRQSFSLMEKFLAEAVKVRQPFQKIIRETPLETWDEKYLKLFISETDWLAEEREKAKSLLSHAK